MDNEYNEFYQFSLVRTDETDAIEKISVSIDSGDGVTHVQLAETFNKFLHSCGFSPNVHYVEEK